MYQEKTIEDIQRDAALAANKAQAEGIRALNYDERRYYARYLTTNSYNGSGKTAEPVHAAFADLVLLEMNIFILNGCPHIYNEKNGTFERDAGGAKIKNRIKKLIDYKIKKAQMIDAIYKLIMKDTDLMITDEEINRRPKHWIHFLDGYYDYKTDSFIPHDPKYHEIGVIPWEYSSSRFPATYKIERRGSGLLRETVEEPLLFNEWLDTALPDSGDQEMLLQYIGYSMTLETGAQKFLMICGSGGTGKSTLLSMIEAIFGRSNISSVSLQGLQDRFSAAMLYLKQANICADIPLSALPDVDMIKKLTGEDLISCEFKYENAFVFRNYARMYFSANNIPINLNDKSNAFYRRMLILKMDHIPEKADPDLAEKLKAEIPNIITRAVEELYCSQGEIYESDNSKALVKATYKKADTIEAFIDDRCEIDETGRIAQGTLYEAYTKYCAFEGRTALTRNSFYNQLDAKGFPRRRGKTYKDVIGLKLSSVVNFPDEIAESVQPSVLP